MGKETRMRILRFFVIASIAICVAFLPFVLMQAAGGGGAGASAGFLYPLTFPLHIFFCVIVGITAVRLAEGALIMLPLSFLLMIVIGTGTDIRLLALPGMRMLTFAAVIFFATAMSIGYNKKFVVASCIFAAIAFYLGADYAASVSNMSIAWYYLTGILCSVALLVISGVAIGVAWLGAIDRIFSLMRRIPAVASFLSFF